MSTTPRKSPKVTARPFRISGIFREKGPSIVHSALPAFIKFTFNKVVTRNEAARDAIYRPAEAGVAGMRNLKL